MNSADLFESRVLLWIVHAGEAGRLSFGECENCKFGRMLVCLRRLTGIQRVMFLFRCVQLFCLKQERASKYSKSS